MSKSRTASSICNTRRHDERGLSDRRPTRHTSSPILSNTADEPSVPGTRRHPHVHKCEWRTDDVALIAGGIVDEQVEDGRHAATNRGGCQVRWYKNGVERAG